MALRQKERATGLIAILTNTEDLTPAKDFERSLTIQKVIESAVPISVMKKDVGHRAIAQALDIQLTKLVANLNLKWNLNDFQIQQIVEDLIDKYPNESLEDFILVFRKARHGEFGELMRLDSAIIFSWMNTYLNEKYAVIENKLHSEKEEFYKPIIPDDKSGDWLKKWKAEIDAIQIKKPAPMTESDIKKEGREQPKKKHHPYTSFDEIQRSELHTQYIRENYNHLTGKPKSNWISEDEWLKQKGL